MTLLSRRQRLLLIKFLGLLSIVRWPNVLFTGVAQYIAAFFVFNPHSGWQTVLRDPKLHAIVFATAFILAAGFIINSFYDIEKDLVNRPHKTLFNRVVSKSFCLNTYFVFNILGLFFGYLGSFRIFLFFLLFSFGLWFYSHKLQKIPLIRELSASLLSVAAFFSIGFHYHYINHIILVYATIFMEALFIRELIKDFRHIEGDRAVGNITIPMYFGSFKAQAILLASGLLLSVTIGYFSTITYTKYAASFAAVMIVLICLSIALVMAGKSNGPKWAHWLWKAMLGILIFYLIFLRDPITWPSLSEFY